MICYQVLADTSREELNLLGTSVVRNDDKQDPNDEEYRQKVQTTIQASFVAQEARRKFDDLRKICSNEKQETRKAKKIAELLAVPEVGDDHLRKPLELIGSDKNDKHPGSKSIETLHRFSVCHAFDGKIWSISQSDNNNTETDTELDPNRFSPCKLRTGKENRKSRIDSLFFEDREAVLVIGGLDPHRIYGIPGNTAKDIYRFEPLGNLWEFVGEMPEPRHRHSVAYLKDRIYLVGGADPRDENLDRRESLAVGSVWSYDPTTRVWFEEASMPTPRKDFGLVVNKGRMYAIGGQDRNGTALRIVEVFNPSDGVWRETRAMSVARIGPATSSYQGVIWVAGGRTASTRDPLTREVECYDPTSGLWSRIDPLRSPRCFASMHVVGESLYVIGGAGRLVSSESDDPGRTDSIESIEDIDVWDLKKQSWRQHGEMIIARHGHTTGLIDNQLLIIGGLTTVYMKSLKSVEGYRCRDAKSIKGVSPLPHAFAGHGSITLPAASLSLLTSRP